MKFKFKIFIYLSFFGFILSSCSTVQKAFDPERKNSSEEFLVEKKITSINATGLQRITYAKIEK